MIGNPPTFDHSDKRSPSASGLAQTAAALSAQDGTARRIAAVMAAIEMNLVTCTARTTARVARSQAVVAASAELMATSVEALARSRDLLDGARHGHRACRLPNPAGAFSPYGPGGRKPGMGAG